MSILVFDTETTGLPNFRASSGDPDQPHICQIGAMLLDRGGRIKAEMNLLIKPDGWEITPETTAIHGITQADAEQYGIGLKGAMGLLWRLVAAADVMVAHNLSFDFFLLRIAAKRAALSEPKDWKIDKFCTCTSTKDILKIPPTEKMLAAGFNGYKNPNLQEAYKHFFGVEFEGAHDAMADVRACRDVYLKLNQPVGSTRRA